MSRNKIVNYMSGTDHNSDILIYWGFRISSFALLIQLPWYALIPKLLQAFLNYTQLSTRSKL